MALNIRNLGVSIVAVCGLSTVVSASWTNRVLQNGSLGGLYQPASWQNTTHFLASNSERALDIQVDYAVFAPGQFPGSYTPFAGFAAPAANEYVYAYQIYNVGTAHGGTSGSAFSQLAVDILSPVSSLGKDESGAGPTGDAGGLSTSFAFLSQQGASYLFLVPALQVDQYSVVLFLTSTYGPSFAQATVYDHGLSATGNLPMPLPTPASASLLVLGLAAARRRRA